VGGGERRVTESRVGGDWRRGVSEAVDGVGGWGGNGEGR